MFDIDRWQEVFTSIRSNVLRTVLSGFTVALGLYIFIVLFGIGNGMKNAFTDAFTGDATNLIQIFTGRTSKAHAGLQKGRKVILNNEDYDFVVTNQGKKIESSDPNYRATMTVKYGNESGTYRVVGASPSEEYIENRKVREGRYISPLDMSRKQKVAVVGRLVQKDLIKKGNPIGKQLNMNGINFTVVGVFTDEGGDWEERSITVPISTLQQLKKGSDTISSIALTYDKNLTTKEAIKMGENIEHELKTKLKVSPDDNSGVIIRNNAKNLEETEQFITVLSVVIFIIGLGTLIAGIIGISNIMVYIVKERTIEIGVRKAIGAKPKKIIALILQETIMVTVLSGIVGVVLGVLTLNLIGDRLEDYFIKEPGVDGGLMITAFLCLIFSGFIAGYIPAKRASEIRPIEALRGN